MPLRTDVALRNVDLLACAMGRVQLARRQEKHMEIHEAIPDFLDSVHLGPRQACKQLTLWPLIARAGGSASGCPDYVALRDALDAGGVTIDEVSAGGSVPHAQVRNRGDVAVLVLFGEELRGAKQDRIPNASFLVSPFSQVVIDVSCIEAGRWGGRSRSGRRFDRGEFDESGSLVSHSMRRLISKKVAHARAMGLGFESDQGEVWEEIGRRVSHARAASPTGAYQDYVATRQSDLDEMRGAFRPVDGQVGFVAVIGDAVVGVEAIGRAEVFARVFDRLVDAYAIDAVDHALVADKLEGSAPERSFSEPEAFLGALHDAHVRSGASLGMGHDLRIEGARLEGCALEAGGVVHLTAYPATV